MKSSQQGQLYPVSSGHHAAREPAATHSLAAGDRWQNPPIQQSSRMAYNAATPHNSAGQFQPQGVSQQLQHHLQGDMQNLNRHIPPHHACQQGPQQQPRHALPAHHPVDPGLAQAEITKARQQLEGKKFQIDTSSCKLPMPEQLFGSSTWQTPQLLLAKEQLNATKDKLDQIDLRPWGRHTTFTNRSGDVVNELRRGPAPPEMATIAWAKMYECLGTYELLPSELYSLDGQPDEASHAKVITVHVCEAPGAFISATNHYIKTRCKSWSRRWTWLANSLNPYHEGNDPNAMIDDDVLIAATEEHWMFGADNSGDIRQPLNIEHMWQQAAAEAAAGQAPQLPAAAALGGSSLSMAAGVALLVTGDGSVDCQENPNEQEAATAALHYCELVCALGLLAPGGNVLLKMFTLFEHSSICMLYLAGCLFEEVHVVKPCSSKPGNSETYLVGLGYKGCPEPLLVYLLQQCGPDVFQSCSLLPLELLPGAFQESATQCAVYFGQQQLEIIEENLRLFQHMRADVKDALLQSKRWLTQQWRLQFQLQPLGRDDFLAPGQGLVGNKNNTAAAVGVNKRKFAGTLAERRRHYKRLRDINDNKERQVTAPATANDAAAAAAGAAIATEGQQSERPLGRDWGKAAGLMAKMGYQEGQGLGKSHQGITQVADLTSNRRRAGLGFTAPEDDGTAGSSVGQHHGQTSMAGVKGVELPSDPYSPKPDAEFFSAYAGQVNSSDRAGWIATPRCQGDSRRRSHSAEFTKQQAQKLLSCKVLSVPKLLRRSKFLPDDELLLLLRDSRQNALAAATQFAMLCQQQSTNRTSSSSSSTSMVTGGDYNNERDLLPQCGNACLHLGKACVAPLPTDNKSASLWHIAALDKVAQLLQHDGVPGSNSSQAAGRGAVRVLDLSPEDCTAARHIVQLYKERAPAAASAQRQQQQGMNSAGVTLHLMVSSSLEGHRFQEQAKMETLLNATAAAEAALAGVDVQLWDAGWKAAAGNMWETVGQFDLVIGTLNELSDELSTQQPLQHLAAAATAFAAAPAPADASTSVTAQLIAAAAVEAAGGQPSVPEQVCCIMESELDTNRQLGMLREAATALQCLAPGGSLVLRLPDSMSSFSAGLLYLLSHCFNSLLLIKPFSSCAASSERFVVCQGKVTGDGCKAVAEQLWESISMLKAAAARLQQGQQAAATVAGTSAASVGQSAAVLELVSPAIIVSTPFFGYLARRNMHLAKVEVAAQLDATKKLQQLRQLLQQKAEGRTDLRSGNKAAAAAAAASRLAEDKKLRLCGTVAAALHAGALDSSHVQTYMKLQEAASEHLAVEVLLSPASPPQESSHWQAPTRQSGDLQNKASFDQQHHQQQNHHQYYHQQQQQQQQGLSQLAFAAPTHHGAAPAHAAVEYRVAPEHLLGSPRHQVQSHSPAIDHIFSSQGWSQAAPNHNRAAGTAAEAPGVAGHMSWSGQLWVTSSRKGNELVCNVTSNSWPSGMPRFEALVVEGYEPVPLDFQSTSGSGMAACQFTISAASSADDSKLKGLWQYMQGWRGPGQRSSVEKVGVITLGMLGKAFMRAVTGPKGEYTFLCIVPGV